MITTDFDVDKPFGNLIKEARLRAGQYNQKLLTQDGAADELDVSDGKTVSRWECGQTMPSNHNAIAMSELYGDPDIKLCYCAKHCPIGKEKKLPYRGTLANKALLLDIALEDLSGAMGRVKRMSGDDWIDENEDADFEQAIELMQEVVKATESLISEARKIRRARERKHAGGTDRDAG